MNRTQALGMALAVLSATVTAPPPGFAQVQPEPFSYPVGLNPYGDNWLALRSLPSTVDGVRLAKLGPETLFTVIGRSGEWARVRLPSGDIGWVNARFVGCCRAATSAPPAPDSGEPVAQASSQSCDGLWYQRNAIYKAAGYCFRTARGINAFGNAGCQFDSEADVPLSARQRAEVNRLQQEERYQGCAR